MLQELKALLLDDLTLTRFDALLVQLTRIADALDRAVPPVRELAPADTVEQLELDFSTSRLQQEWAEIESGLTQARGQAPQEDEILAEYQRRHGAVADATGWSA